MGAVFGLFAGFYYRFWKITGYRYSETLGQAHFRTTFIGVNLTFFPMHFLGLAGMPRRIPDYPDIFEFRNNVASLGSLISLAGLVIFFVAILQAFSRRMPIDELALEPIQYCNGLIMDDYVTVRNKTFIIPLRNYH